jgi:hypothetical protein
MSGSSRRERAGADRAPDRLDVDAGSVCGVGGAQQRAGIISRRLVRAVGDLIGDQGGEATERRGVQRVEVIGPQIRKQRTAETAHRDCSPCRSPPPRMTPSAPRGRPAWSALQRTGEPAL